MYYAAGDVIPFILFQLISFNCYLISSPFFLSLFLICLAANKERKKKNAESNNKYFINSGEELNVLCHLLPTAKT